MKTAALIVTTGPPRISGIRALSEQVGAVSAGQRMIAAFQRCGVALTGLVVGPENKKAERSYAQAGVVFLRCEADASFLDGVREGLRFLHGKYDRVFVLPGDMPLVLPETLDALLGTEAPIARPICRKIHGLPLLLDGEAMTFLLSSADCGTLEETLAQCPLETEYLPVSDSGVLIRSGDMTHRSKLIQVHDRQLTRPCVGITLNNCSILCDDRLSMLLHLVYDTRSVLDACSLMQMSYSAAWKMLNQVENAIGYPLVRRIRGGPEGSGTELTEKGRVLMEAFDRYTQHLNREAQTLFQQHFSAFSEYH